MGEKQCFLFAALPLSSFVRMRADITPRQVALDKWEPHPLWCLKDGTELWEPELPGHLKMGFKRIYDDHLKPIPGEVTWEQHKKRNEMREHQGLPLLGWIPPGKGNLHGYLDPIDTKKEDMDKAKKSNTDEREVSRKMIKYLRGSARINDLPMCRGAWVPILSILDLPEMKSKNVTQQQIFTAVIANGKSRYQLSKDLNFVRAVQGHLNSLQWLDHDVIMDRVTVEVQSAQFIVHGTYLETYNNKISRYGINKMDRAMIHFGDSSFSKHVREQGNVMIYISMWEAAEAGHKIYMAENGVYCIQGPVMPELFKGVITKTGKTWTWDWWNNCAPHPSKSVDKTPDKSIADQLRWEANERLSKMDKEPAFTENRERPRPCEASEPHNKRQRKAEEVNIDKGDIRDVPVESSSLDCSKHYGEDDVEFMSAESPRYTSDDATSAWEDHVKKTEDPTPQPDVPYITRDQEDPQTLNNEE